MKNKILYINSRQNERGADRKKVETNTVGGEALFADNSNHADQLIQKFGNEISAVIFRNVKPEHVDLVRMLAQRAKTKGVNTFGYENYSERKMTEGVFRKNSAAVRAAFSKELIDVSPTLRIADDKDVEHHRITLNDKSMREFIQDLRIEVRQQVKAVEEASSDSQDFDPDEDYIILDDEVIIMEEEPAHAPTRSRNQPAGRSAQPNRRE